MHEIISILHIFLFLVNELLDDAPLFFVLVMCSPLYYICENK